MSRSYREPWFVDGYGSRRKRFSKNYANRIIRRVPVHQDLGDGSWYRKFNESWDICDYKFLWDPYPRYYWRNGEMQEIHHDPEWKARRK